jgi:hypothetical protein
MQRIVKSLLQAVLKVNKGIGIPDNEMIEPAKTESE